MTRLPVAIEMRFLRIPTRWTAHSPANWWSYADFPARDGRTVTVGEGMEPLPSERILVPDVNQEVERRLVPVDAWELRDRFLRMKRDEKSAIQFLNEIGVWGSVEDQTPPPELAKTAIAGSFGFRLFFGRALLMTLGDLWREQTYWAELLEKARLKPGLLRDEFGPPPPEDAAPIKKSLFAGNARFRNQLPLHIEWRRRRPCGVVQPITGQELLVATLHADLISGAQFQVCQRRDCGITFTGRKKVYCSFACAHVMASRMWRKHEKDKQKKERSR